MKKTEKVPSIIHALPTKRIIGIQECRKAAPYRAPWRTHSNCLSWQSMVRIENKLFPERFYFFLKEFVWMVVMVHCSAPQGAVLQHLVYWPTGNWKIMMGIEKDFIHIQFGFIYCGSILCVYLWLRPTCLHAKMSCPKLETSCLLPTFTLSRWRAFTSFMSFERQPSTVVWRVQLNRMVQGLRQGGLVGAVVPLRILKILLLH